MIWTFWEGEKPAYIDLCMRTWQQDYVLLNYENFERFTELDIDRVKRYTLPQIADCVRVHVLRDQGGVWLDADTIMLTGRLPKTNMIGNPITRTQSIGYLRTEANSEMFKLWAKHQDEVINRPDTPKNWDVMGNAFTDPYVRQHEDITICNIDNAFPEIYMLPPAFTRLEKYKLFFFEDSYNLADIKFTDIIMLHNSWTPQFYKDLSENGALDMNCTLSNILREVLEK